MCAGNGDCLLRDGSEYGIDDGFGIACLIASSKGSCFGFSEALYFGGPAVACKEVQNPCAVDYLAAKGLFELRVAAN